MGKYLHMDGCLDACTQVPEVPSPAFSNTVFDQTVMVYTAKVMAPTGSIHHRNLLAMRAAARPTRFVTMSK